MSLALKQRLLTAMLMSLLLSGLMTAWVTWLNLGFTAHFVGLWLHAYVCAWPAAFVIVVLLGPWVQRLSLRLLQNHAGAPMPLARVQTGKPQ